MVVSNADFPQYKESFLAENRIPRDWVLLRRIRDNILSIAKKEDAESYEGHVIEPVDKSGVSVPKAKAPAKPSDPKPKTPKAKAPAPVKEETPNPDDQSGEVDPNTEEA